MCYHGKAPSIRNRNLPWQDSGHNRSVQCINPPQYAIWLVSWPRHPVFYHKLPRESYGVRNSIVLSKPHGWIPAQATQRSTLSCRRNFRHKERYIHSTQRQSFETKHPVFFNELSKKLLVHDTTPSSLRHRSKLPG